LEAEEHAKSFVLKLANDLVNLLSDKPEGREVALHDIDKAEYKNGKAMAALRYWGKWETPSDAEDDEDYDWQNLSSESSKKLKDYIETFNNRHPEVTITFNTGEKNWIYVYVK
jgi:hypothetical protein